VDVYTYVFYLGVSSDGSTPDGYLHYMTNNQQTGAWSDDITLPYSVDTDSVISAVNFYNSTDSYIFVYYKYLGVIQWIEYTSTGSFYPSDTNLGFSTGLSSTSGPSAVVYNDPYYDTVIVSLYFSAYQSSTSDYRVFNAIGLPYSWP